MSSNIQVLAAGIVKILELKGVDSSQNLIKELNKVAYPNGPPEKPPYSSEWGDRSDAIERARGVKIGFRKGTTIKK